AVADWRKEIFGTTQEPAVAANAKGRAKAKQAARLEDDRPYPVGYAEFPMTPLPARDGVAHGGVKRSAGAPNCSYFVNWKSLEDSMTWDVDVHSAGEYEAVIYYTCPLADAGSTVELSLGASRVSGKVSPGWDPPMIANQDRVARTS